MSERIVRFKEWDCFVEKEQYTNGRTALVLYECGDPHRERIAVATCNLPEFPLDADQVLIKDWGENEGIIDALEAAGIVRDIGARVPTGYTEAALCTLLI